MDKKTLTLSRFNAANFVSSKIHIQLVSMETYTCNQMMTLLIAALSKMININSSYCKLGQFFCNIPLFILICITKLCLIIAALSKVKLMIHVKILKQSDKTRFLDLSSSYTKYECYNLFLPDYLYLLLSTYNMNKAQYFSL